MENHTPQDSTGNQETSPLSPQQVYYHPHGPSSPNPQQSPIISPYNRQPLPPRLLPTSPGRDTTNGTPQPGSPYDRQPSVLSHGYDALPRELPRPVTLIPKPKPGRKPATDVPADKRKASNREAQRKFRERRKRRLEEALKDVEKQKVEQQRHAAENVRLREEMDHRHRMQAMHSAQTGSGGLPSIPPDIRPASSQSHRPPRILPSKEVKAELDEYRFPRMAPPARPHIQTRTSSSSHGSRHSISGQSSLPTPVSSLSSNSAISPGQILPWPKQEPQTPGASRQEPFSQQDAFNMVSSLPQPNLNGRQQPQEDSAPPMEIDFTSMGRAGQAAASGESSELLDDESCGFCTDGSYCVCKDKGPQRSELQPLEPRTSASGPGSCDACKSDPGLAKMCRDMSDRSTRVNQRDSGYGGSMMLPLSRTSTGYSTGQPQHTRVPPGEYLTCGDAGNWVRRHDPNIVNHPRYNEFLAGLRTTTHDPERPCTSCDSGGDCHSHQDVEVASILQSLGNVRTGQHTSAEQVPLRNNERPAAAPDQGITESEQDAEAGTESSSSSKSPGSNQANSPTSSEQSK